MKHVSVGAQLQCLDRMLAICLPCVWRPNQSTTPIGELLPSVKTFGARQWNEAPVISIVDFLEL